VHRYSYAPSGLSEVVQWDGDLLELDRARPMEMVVRPRGLVMLTDHGTPGAEKFRSLAIRLKNFQKRQGLKKLLVTSSVKGEGKSVISANLAVALAQTQRTLVIDCDLHQAGLRDVFGIHGQAGLGEWWKQQRSAKDFLRRMENHSLWYLSAGRSSEEPLEILQSQRFSEMLSQVAGWFDWIILDSPPLLPVADSSLLAAQTDGTLLVIRQANTPKPLLKEALKTENLKLLGIVANEWESSAERYYSQYYKGYVPHSRVETEDDRHSSDATARAV